MLRSALSSLVRNRIRRVVILLAVTVVWGLSFGPLLFAHLAFNEKYLESDIVSAQLKSEPGVIVWGFFRGFTPATADVVLDIGSSTFRLDADEMLMLEVGKNSFNITPGIAKRISIPAYPIDNRDMTIYPLDEYEEDCTITATYASGAPANIAFGLVVSGQAYRLHHTITKPATNQINLHYRLERHATTKVMCLLTFALIWLLSLAMINLTIDTVLYRRDTPAAIILAGFTIVFSLPTLRKSQPGIPDVGSILDLAGFFW